MSSPYLRFAKLGVHALIAMSIAAATVSPASASTDPGGRCPATAAASRDWGRPATTDAFRDWPDLEQWAIYDGPGHVGNGRRTPTAFTFYDDMLDISGDFLGNSGGMTWLPPSLYGRWEVCAKMPAVEGESAYHPVILLWPDSRDWPRDGEIDFMEIIDPARQMVTATMHHLIPDSTKTFLPTDQAAIAIDASEWHSWAVEWMPDHVSGYVDGRQWFRLTDNIPSTPMRLCIQLDNMGGDIFRGAHMYVSSARQWHMGPA